MPMRMKTKSSAQPWLYLKSRIGPRWRRELQTGKLEDCYRYLCLIEETGKLGWAWVASSRITFVSQGLSTRVGLLWQDVEDHDKGDVVRAR